jgi:hypothetical protein
MEITELGELDKFIRNIINKMVGGPALSKDIFTQQKRMEDFDLDC